MVTTNRSWFRPGKGPCIVEQSTLQRSARFGWNFLLLRPTFPGYFFVPVFQPLQATHPGSNTGVCQRVFGAKMSSRKSPVPPSSPVSCLQQRNLDFSENNNFRPPQRGAAAMQKLFLLGQTSHTSQPGRPSLPSLPAGLKIITLYRWVCVDTLIIFKMEPVSMLLSSEGPT